MRAVGSVLLAVLSVACTTSSDVDMRLFSSINTGYYEGAAAALKAGANPNARDVDGNTPLHNAGAFNRIEIARLLIESGARVDARRGLPLLGMAETPLMWAAKHKSIGTARVLLEKGASRDAFLFYGSAAEFARSSGDPEMAEFIAAWKPVGKQ